MLDIYVFLISQHKLLISLPLFFTFVAFLCCFLLQLLVFVEFVVCVAGWVGAHALSWGRYVMRLSAQN